MSCVTAFTETPAGTFQNEGNHKVTHAHFLAVMAATVVVALSPPLSLCDFGLVQTPNERDSE